LDRTPGRDHEDEMMTVSEEAEFDRFAGSYDDDLNRGLALSGEGKEYFVRRRVDWLAHRLRQLGERPRSVLDYGCGTGTAIPFLRDLLGADEVVGADVSSRSLEEARRALGSDPNVRFATVGERTPDEDCDLVYTSGVFHHIRTEDRPGAVDYVRRSLRPGGLFAFWENNPWNPATRLVMSRIPFDRDAITLSPPEARRLLSAGGLRVLLTDFQLVFPKMLAALRVAEPYLTALPLGTQYLVLARRTD
jgi:SAM-dependent methyltransferase